MGHLALAEKRGVGTMTRLFVMLLAAASACVALEGPVHGQTVPVHGRIEDAVWRQPLTGVRVFSTDSSAAVLTDSLGAFTILMPREGPFTILAERLGYLSQRFDLGMEAPLRISVLLLDPAPIELEGITAIGEAAITRVLSDLKRRRNAYSGPVRAFNRAALDPASAVGTLWDFIRQSNVQLFECHSAMSGLCVPDRRYHGLRGGPREIPVRICIDGRESWGAAVELNSLDVKAVAVIEIYDHGRGGIQVFTPGYLAISARDGRSVATPTAFGC